MQITVMLCKHLLKLILVLIFFSSCNSQINKYSTIEFASFRNAKMESHKDSLFVTLYSKIDNKGLVSIRFDDTYFDTIQYYTYQLNAEELNRLNSFFRFNNPLKRNLTNLTLEKNEIFVGDYNYCFVSYGGDHKDSLCYIEQFIDAEFDSVYFMLNDIYFNGKNIKAIAPFEIPKIFKVSLRQNYKQAYYLPERQTPPPF